MVFSFRFREAEKSLVAKQQAAVDEAKMAREKAQELVVKKATVKQETSVEEGLGRFISSQAIGLRALLEMTERESLNVTQVVAEDKAKEFSAGQAPFEELAQVETMLRSGVTVDQIVTLGATGSLPVLTAPETQTALVRLVEDQGYRAVVRKVNKNVSSNLSHFQFLMSV